MCKLTKQLFIACSLRSVLFVCGLATLIAIETSYCKSYTGMVVYFRVISYVPLSIFAESFYSHKFHKKLNFFVCLHMEYEIRFSFKPSSTVFAHALVGGLAVMCNVMFFKFTLQVAVECAFFTKEACFVVPIHVVRERAG